VGAIWADAPQKKNQYLYFFEIRINILLPQNGYKSRQKKPGKYKSWYM
jgi:hypothetical protein